MNRRRILILLAVTAAKLYLGLARCFGKESPRLGRIGQKVLPGLYPLLTERFRGRILIAGTNGKTTTAGILTELLTSSGYKVLTNNYKCNQPVGVFTTILLSDLHLRREYTADYAVFEVDEVYLIDIFPRFKPHIKCKVYGVKGKVK